MELSNIINSLGRIPATVFLWLVFLVPILINIAFSIGVVIAIRRQRDLGKGPWFVGTEIWALATLLGGVFVAATYWLIHHSTLNRED